ncbi:MAG: bifunctional methylenetetrahydrofolate dehydrogenase/methenyltetrahydrofolate cyclohydrolase FolD [Candidatus Binatia bacterium]|nr:bifunctional methylenetetrahydrofolate dehydrogenase/methenyltetrahydrofolate cyclohydrolase FolD [Candidatus Binatia bacterium]
MAELIDGKAAAQEVREQVRQQVLEFESHHGMPPGLATVLVGSDPASATYVRSKRRACAEVGIASFPYELHEHTTLDELLALIGELNERADVHGILVQLPLPAHLPPQTVIGALDPRKDVDGLHPVNQGRLLQGLPGLRPCTPLGVMALLDRTRVSLTGAHAVVVGRSTLVGKPTALLLLERDATVTLCHSRTRDLARVVQGAEVLVVATGRPGLVRGDWVRMGAVVIDVGINRLPDGTLVGDVDFSSASARAAFITPVPGGVGPMTVAMLLRNTVQAAKWQAEGTL